MTVRLTESKNIKNVLIYRCGTIGDAIVAVPAINLLRNYFNESIFSLMTANDGDGKIWANEIFCEFDWFKSFLTYSSRGLKKPRYILSLIKKVRECRPDMVIYMASDKNSGMKILRDRIFFFLSGVRRFIPLRSSKATFWGHLRRSKRIYPREVVRLTEGLQALGIKNREISFHLPIQERHIEKVSNLTDESGFDSKRHLIGMCPWSKMEAKRWPLERYALLGERLIKEFDANVAIVGGKEEAMVGEDISQFWPKDRWAIFAGKLSILETGELLRRCSFYVGNDTGAMHLAAAMGTPSVAIFSARDQEESWFPFGDNNIILRKDVSCQNCYLTQCQKYNLRCLKEISLEEVWVNCQKMFEIRGKGSRKILHDLT
jgi:ADP-heptose:LPS heptosyltransferase